jgi:hypothetical protein
MAKAMGYKEGEESEDEEMETEEAPKMEAPTGDKESRKNAIMMMIKKGK